MSNDKRVLKGNLTGAPSSDEVPKFCTYIPTQYGEAKNGRTWLNDEQVEISKRCVDSNHK